MPESVLLLIPWFVSVRDHAHIMTSVLGQWLTTPPPAVSVVIICYFDYLIFFIKIFKKITWNNYGTQLSMGEGWSRRQTLRKINDAPQQTYEERSGKPFLSLTIAGAAHWGWKQDFITEWSRNWESGFGLWLKILGIHLDDKLSWDGQQCPWVLLCYLI